MPITRMVSGDVAEVRALLASVETELIADYGAIAWARNNTARSAYLNARVTDARFFPLVLRDGGGVLRGLLCGIKAEDQWAIELAVVDKTLSAADRGLLFLDLVRDLAVRVPSETVISGIMRIGGRLDLLLAPRLTNRKEVSATGVRYSAAAAEVAAL